MCVCVGEEEGGRDEARRRHLLLCPFPWLPAAGGWPGRRAVAQQVFAFAQCRRGKAEVFCVMPGLISFVMYNLKIDRFIHIFLNIHPLLHSQCDGRQTAFSFLSFRWFYVLNVDLTRIFFFAHSLLHYLGILENP
uniref:Uncharacterized protein n=1 Tax=Trypanosoma congolense (strain IL3000) TaxID=1068625 RepID=G0UM58_TRYCI|nr:hypothetical protein, unlikely [Trypanosoma congolense IL3000]